MAQTIGERRERVACERASSSLRGVGFAVVCAVSGCGARTDLPGTGQLRQIAPLSTARVTSTHPTFRFDLGGRGGATATIEVCSERACATPEFTSEVHGASFRSPRPLSSGVHFWRLRASDQTLSPTWEFFVGHHDAAIDTSWGTVLDPNGDGHADVALEPLDGSGCVPIFFGSASGLSEVPDVVLVGPNGSQGKFGWSAASAGDVNGDGYGDLIVGAVEEPVSNEGPHGPGRAYLYYGDPAGVRPEPAHVLEAAAGLLADYGGDVGAVGDVNGDGYADVFVTASGLGRDFPGSTTIIEGGPTGFTPSVQGIIEGPERLVVPASGGVAVEYHASAAGDVNGDGFADLLVSSWCSASACGPGHAQVHFGGSKGLSSVPDISLFEPDLSLIPPEFGMSSAGGVDIDGDGFSDVIVGAPRCADPNCETAGRVYVFPGSRSGTSAKPMVTWFDATTGGPPTDFGRRLLALGDVDGDGFDDLLINPTGTNTAYSFAGGPKPGSGPTETLAAPDDVASPGASFAFIASPGDIDGDSRADAVAASVAGLVTSATPSGTVLEYSGSGSGLVRALPFARPYPSCP